MRVLTALPEDDLRLVTDAARAAEAAGYDGLLTMENRHDPFLPHALAADVFEYLDVDVEAQQQLLRRPQRRECRQIDAIDGCGGKMG